MYLYIYKITFKVISAFFLYYKGPNLCPLCWLQKALKKVHGISVCITVALQQSERF